MSSKQLAELYARRADYKPPQMEKDLQQEIADYCRRQKWPFMRHSMAHKVWGTLGWPDFTILLPGRKLLLAECKRKGQKLKPQQEGISKMASGVGHEIHVITSFDEFMSVLCKYIC